MQTISKQDQQPQNEKLAFIKQYLAQKKILTKDDLQSITLYLRTGLRTRLKIGLRTGLTAALRTENSGTRDSAGLGEQ